MLYMVIGTDMILQIWVLHAHCLIFKVYLLHHRKQTPLLRDQPPNKQHGNNMELEIHVEIVWKQPGNKLDITINQGLFLVVALASFPSMLTV